MSETRTPVEVAAEALHQIPTFVPHGAYHDGCETFARTTFGSVDVDVLANVLAVASPCTWSIPDEAHPYAEACHHKRYGQGRGACWDVPYAQAEAVIAWLTGGGA